MNNAFNDLGEILRLELWLGWRKQYEFGSKVSLATLPSSNVVVGIENFSSNPRNIKTLSVTLRS